MSSLALRKIVANPHVGLPAHLEYLPTKYLHLLGRAAPRRALGDFDGPGIFPLLRFRTDLRGQQQPHSMTE